MKTRDNGAALKRKRLRADLTQRQLAGLVNRTDTTIWMLETGRMTTCTEELALAIARRLGCDVEDLFEQRTSSRVPVVAGVSPDTSQVA